jgi:hypothetical protein
VHSAQCHYGTLQPQLSRKASRPAERLHKERRRKRGLPRPALCAISGIRSASFTAARLPVFTLLEVPISDTSSRSRNSNASSSAPRSITSTLPSSWASPIAIMRCTSYHGASTHCGNQPRRVTPRPLSSRSARPTVGVRKEYSVKRETLPQKIGIPRRRPVVASTKVAPRQKTESPTRRATVPPSDSTVCAHTVWTLTQKIALLARA